jgi:hypothetical protein
MPRSLSLILTVSAAFLTYFCMYGVRKPFTAAAYAEPVVLGLAFKELLVIAQVLGYMLSKFIGIKVTSELPPNRRAMAILLLVAIAELALVLFPLVPRPWSAVCLFLNGLPLGMVFGIVVGFLEGRRATEALTAGLCTSFILADGVTKSLGAWLLEQGVQESWMPAAAGAIFLLPLLVGLAMLARVPPPDPADVDARSARDAMTKADRRALLGRWGFGLGGIVFVYLLVTIMRSYRADFGPQLWEALLGTKAAPEAFTQSELWVALGVLLAGGATVAIRDNRRAFFASLGISAAGFVVLATALLAWRGGGLGPFGLMVALGLGLYLPYVAIHTTVFERFLATTRERGNLGFLMSFADAFGYLGYVAAMVGRSAFAGRDDLLSYFVGMTVATVVLSLVVLAVVVVWFLRRTRP